ncbi:hypothetical protein CI610_02538 [invertebrate metagenome]|uniref:CCHC-type domain-containing protein n=1 Tax=invertebrate metagenome TaxID=1711999 RepID=A0A2H9T5P4_9ZZZZ
MKAATYDGTSAWLDYKAHFEACARINGWSKREKGLYLAVSLRGQAQGILGDLPRGNQEDYEALVKALQERFAPPDQNELYRVQLLERRQKASESLPELGQAIRRLVNLAYPTVPSNVRDTLAKQQFIESLADSEMRIRIKQARPQDLTNAIRLAVELEAYNRAEKHGKDGRSYLRTATSEESNPAPTEKGETEKMLTDMHLKLDALKKEIEKLRSKREGNQNANRGKDQPTNISPGSKACYKCGSKNHFRRDCPQLKQDKDSKGLKTPPKPSAKPAHTKSTAGVGISSAALEAGMYVKAKIQNVDVQLLVDTGATITIISDEVYNRIPLAMRPELQKVTQEILAANGAALESLGRGSFLIRPEGCNTMCFEAVVAKISTDGLLGLDFMKSKNGVVDLKKGCLTIDEEEVDMRYEGSLGCYRVCCSEKIIVPAHSEVLVPGKVCKPVEKEIRTDSLLVEGLAKFMQSDRALIARSLVRNEPVIPIRLMNLKEEPQVIYPGTSLAQVTPIQDTLETVEANTSGASSN